MLQLLGKEMMALFTRFLKENRLGSSLGTEMAIMKLTEGWKHDIYRFSQNQLFEKCSKSCHQKA